MNKDKPRKIPIIFYISAISSLAAFFILRAARGSYSFADKVSSGVGAFLRRLFTYPTDLFSFSLFEAIICLIPVILTLLIFFAVRAFKRRRKCRFLLTIVSIIGIIYTFYALMMGASYHTTPLEDKLSLDADAEITAAELDMTLDIIIPELNALAEEVGFDGSTTVMPYSFDKLSAKICDAYSTVSDTYGIVPKISTRAKPIYFSGVMSTFRITGIYTFYTGEANVNMAYPDYNLPFTVAHELAHQRGIMRENEANFVAFLVCISSTDPYIRYSGYLNMYEYLISALYKTDRELWQKQASRLCEKSIADIKASNAVYEQYADTVVGDISHSINDMYLQANGTQGTVSYGLVTRLAVAYYAQERLAQ